MVWETAKNKVVGAGWGTRLNPKQQQRLDSARNWRTTSLITVLQAADLMRTTQYKISQYIGIKYGEDISNKLNNNTKVTILPPVYSAAIMLRNQE